ncbi:chemotaxis phosphatase chex [Lucifera butyrica]|uniref:Chemotaxis phosphatase chex n=1 Tax=Lucifera butyrica TaxID=1351585 RepID=A0A498RAW9_9FIRM|nr:chemotaxis protein CheX [Lucifera butyrica]VBB07422.1 chemotaxis phosphatase chex [Lucifera butyrica]
MDARFVNPFIAALSDVLPQLGFKNIARGKVFTKDQFLDSLGVTVNVELVTQTTGNVVFNMTEEVAKKLSSVIMMGAIVNKLDDIAQSALCEMANMVTSTAATSLKNNGIPVKLAPPALSQCTSQIKICNTNYIGLEMTVDELMIEISIGLN